MAAELLAAGSSDPDGSRARVNSGAHPDLTWVAPSGAHEILVSDVEGPVISAASKTPFESSCRVFVIERVDELGEEAANRMLKTLEEPASFVHLILLTDKLVEVLPTIRSRCQLVRFEAPSVQDVAAGIRELGVAEDTAMACARLSLGDSQRARELATPDGAGLRAGAQELARAALAGQVSSRRPWLKLLAAVRARSEAMCSELETRAEQELELYPRRDRKRVETEWAERIRRTRRRVETATLDLALQLVTLWFSDLACLAWGAGALVRHADRSLELSDDSGIAPARLQAAVELVEDTRLRFALNVSEELACEALAYRLEGLLGSRASLVGERAAAG